ncbi:hypothetical protein H6F67_19220 [Microcoleus sp. FACHB-1515]|uniref:hypothetical protein n=1 Tax=Cyanophyceae TaxID=3028117 RepID=UPI00168376CC|nr:hypothetical protein [Microcoleus sp. FACHB-1515]MBD2091981.1 hypothetical protein [Microcoleus sp. FACHB-1515]
MPEDAGKKKFIKDFLQRVKAGEGLIEDIWIERTIRAPGSDGEGSTAQSLSRRRISNLTELLEDDLRHSFDEGYFTFRFVAALVGSGKTSLLTYLHGLTKTKSAYQRFSVVNRFQLSDLLMTGGNQSFSVKLYSYVLAQTFWELLHSSESEVQKTAKSILSDYLEQAEVHQLVGMSKFPPFLSKFSNYFGKSQVVFEDFFFETIEEIHKVEPRFTFAYLIDELDSLQNFPSQLQETRSLVTALVKRVAQEFNSKIRLLIYLVGTSENVGSFIAEGSVIESLVGHQVINLNKGYGNEFGMIKNKIDDRIEKAFGGYKNFDVAWQEIQSIPLNPAQNLRKFCQAHASAVLEIYERYFTEEPEKSFEGNARDLVKAQCEQHWKDYLNKSSYSLSDVSTTTILSGHAFDCFVELKHNNSTVARCFGEAKNYELLSGHLETFDRWLQDVSFKPSTDGKTPPDLAFMIAPSCPSLLQRKLELKGIKFLQSDKVVDKNKKSSEGIEEESESTQPTSQTVNLCIGINSADSTNINSADKDALIIAFKGTGVKKTTLDRLIKERPFKDLDDLAARLNFTSVKVKAVLRKKVREGQISFLEN